jgi:hypothetical protein
VIERGGPEGDNRLARARLRVGDLFEGEPFGPAEFAEQDGFHDG